MTVKKQEQQRMDDVISKIKIAEREHHKEIKKAESDTHAIKDDFSNNLRLKTETYSGIFETAATVRQQQQMLQERENSWQHATKRLDILKKLEKTPYFARIDFQEKGEKKAESIYIGLGSFADRPDNFLIYDWRAPISSIYYDGGIGQITYQTPDGPQQVDVTLKRQFVVENGKIKTVFDTDEAVGDQMLLDVLDESSDTKMKSIVTTIQKEQNQIIRETDAELLFVQGAAGSGKTSAVLQRVAYLLYRYRGKLSSSQVILFSPNQLFNDYIDQVLPELGEHNMVQMTYYQYAQRRLPRIKVETLQERFEAQRTATQQKILNLKNSLYFFDAATTYTQYLEKKGMHFKNIMFRGKPFFRKEKISQIYYNFNENYHLRTRLSATKERLLKTLNRRVESESRTEWVEKAIQDASQQQLNELYGDHPRNFENGDKEMHYLARQLVMEQYKKIHADIIHTRFININAQYVHFLKNVPELIDLDKYGISEAEWKDSVLDVIARFKAGKMQLTDVTPYLRLYDRITGKRGNTEMRHVFIDEIQDYTPYQLAFLKENFPRARFTVLGDLNQAIFTKMNSYNLLEDVSTMFPQDKTKVVQLTKSYRSTKQITDFTKQILVDGTAVESFERRGDLPQIMVDKTTTALAKDVALQVRKNNEDKLTTAIICKTLDECEKLLKALREDDVKVTLIKTENQRLAAGTIIVPAFLAKGLEFDAVIMWNANDKNYALESERQLVYTICSRAMHRLNIYAEGRLSPLFNQVPAEFYQLK
ncbi:ATP-dependent DNA helicase [Liquorilactobacillus capillatus DSM 19910]|uniref:ATP-dependent DNA helicase n=1 Tax=Liquorilactobacillus capillatus DSM 19910 TaxID=1423731 RepID=A0A0R1M6A9_9LACO|nr:ATP-dependent DNA helicase [Liquorilactobacillus capillatus DSM 19910]